MPIPGYVPKRDRTFRPDPSIRDAAIASGAEAMPLAEVVVNNGLTNTLADRLDAGVRLGEQVEKDMVAVRIGPDLRIAAFAAPSYFEGRRKPLSPDDLTGHACINLRLPTRGGHYA